MILSTNESIIVASNVRGKTALVECVSRAPLKLLTPRISSSAAHVVVSNYGGGYVDGDQINLRVRVEENSALCMSSQSFTRVYKTISGVPSLQSTMVEARENACIVLFPDPLVIHRNGIFRQSQTIKLHHSSTAVILDWFHAGRILCAEKFAFHRYQSSLDILVDGSYKVVDRFDTQPGRLPPDLIGNFGPATVWLSLFIVCADESRIFRVLTEAIPGIMPSNALKNTHEPFILSYAGGSRPGVFVVRMLAERLSDAQAFVTSFARIVSNENILGFNPLSGKH